MYVYDHDITFNVNFRQQVLVSFDIIALSRCYCRKVQFDEIRYHMASISESPVQRIKTAAQIYDLALVSGFLDRKDKPTMFHKRRNANKPNQKYTLRNFSTQL